MVNRKGVFIGAYVPKELKELLRRQAISQHRTISQEITKILTEALNYKAEDFENLTENDNQSRTNSAAN